MASLGVKVCARVKAHSWKGPAVRPLRTSGALLKPRRRGMVVRGAYNFLAGGHCLGASPN